MDPDRFAGTCYLAASWLALARTTGRGLARAGQTYQSTLKLIYVKAKGWGEGISTRKDQ